MGLAISEKASAVQVATRGR